MLLPLLIGFAALPGFASIGTLIFLTEAITILIMAYMWNFFAGYANIITVGQHAFVGLGCYAFYAATSLAGWPPGVAVLASGPVALMLAAPIYGLLTRLRDAYFAVASWVLAEVLMILASRLPQFGGGSGTSLPVPVIRQFGSTPGERTQNVYWLALGLLVLSFAATYLILRSRLGLALRAVRDNEAGAAAAGVNVAMTRAICFLWTAPILGMAGALVVMQKLRISPTGSFSLIDWTVYITFVVIIGGVGSLEGPLVGTILFLVLRELLADYGAWYLIALGACAIAVILWEPRGLWGIITRARPFELFPLRHRSR